MGVRPRTGHGRCAAACGHDKANDMACGAVVRVCELRMRGMVMALHDDADDAGDDAWAVDAAAGACAGVEAGCGDGACGSDTVCRARLRLYRVRAGCMC